MTGRRLVAIAMLAVAFGGTSRGGAEETVMAAPTEPRSHKIPMESDLPSLAGANSWLNSPPLTPDGLLGKVVLVDFWCPHAGVLR